MKFIGFCYDGCVIIGFLGSSIFFYSKRFGLYEIHCLWGFWPHNQGLGLGWLGFHLLGICFFPCNPWKPCLFLILFEYLYCTSLPFCYEMIIWPKKIETSNLVVVQCKCIGCTICELINQYNSLSFWRVAWKIPWLILVQKLFYFISSIVMDLIRIYWNL